MGGGRGITGSGEGEGFPDEATVRDDPLGEGV